MSDITSSSCMLKWKPPEDDGGKPIKNYLVEKMDKATGKWVPVAHVTEPECQVRGLQEGHDYFFRVKAINDEGESEPLETEAAIKAKDPFSESSSSYGYCNALLYASATVKVLYATLSDLTCSR